MAIKYGDITLLSDPVAQKLLESRNVAQLVYVWRDGTPRVVPIWFHWNGQKLIFGCLPSAPKLKGVQSGSKLAVTISSDEPSRVLYIRGAVSEEIVDGVAPEYVLAAKRYLGDEALADWIQEASSIGPQTTRITLVPEWVIVLDLERQLPKLY